jgi:hypothetical protein
MTNGSVVIAIPADSEARLVIPHPYRHGVILRVVLLWV